MLDSGDCQNDKLQNPKNFDAGCDGLWLSPLVNQEPLELESAPATPLAAAHRAVTGERLMAWKHGKHQMVGGKC